MKLAAFSAMALVWGLTWIMAKWATAATPPILVAGIRFMLASAAFFSWCWLRHVSLQVPAYGRLLAASLLINSGCYSFIFWGIAHTPTGLAAVVNLSLIPILSMLIGALYGEERVTPMRLAALALGSFGLALLFLFRDASADQPGHATAWGLASVIVGTVSYAWGAIVSKPLVRAMPPAAVAAWQTLIGGVSLLAVSLLIEPVTIPALAALANGQGLAGLLFLVLGGSLVGFSVYLWLLREWGAFRAGLYAFVSPIIAVAVGVMVLNEPFGWIEGVGMAILLAATGLVIRQET